MTPFFAIVPQNDLHFLPTFCLSANFFVNYKNLNSLYYLFIRRASFFIAQKSFFFKRIFHKNTVIKNTFFFEKIKKEQTAE